jgi:hypothetical protein
MGGREGMGWGSKGKWVEGMGWWSKGKWVEGMGWGSKRKWVSGGNTRLRGPIFKGDVHSRNNKLC